MTVGRPFNPLTTMMSLGFGCGVLVVVVVRGMLRRKKNSPAGEMSATPSDVGVVGTMSAPDPLPASGRRNTLRIRMSVPPRPMSAAVTVEFAGKPSGRSMKYRVRESFDHIGVSPNDFETWMRAPGPGTGLRYS